MLLKDRDMRHKNWPDSASAMSDCFMLAPSKLKKGIILSLVVCCNPEITTSTTINSA